MFLVNQLKVSKRDSTYCDCRSCPSFEIGDVVLSNVSPFRVVKAIYIEWGLGTEVDIGVDVADVV